MRQNLKAVLLKVNVGGMELCWLYVLFVLLDKLLAVGIPFEPWYLIFYPLSICFHRVFLNKQSASVYSIVLSVFVWGLVWLIVMRSQTVNNLHLLDPTWFVKFFQTLVDVDRTLSPELFITVTSAIIWGISARLTTLKVSFSILLREFQLGFIILLVAFFIETQLKIQLTGAIPAVILLFFLALTSIPLTQVGESQNRLSGLPIGYKLIFTMVSIGTIFLLGLLVSLTLNPELLDVVLSILKSILDLILKIIRFLNGLFPAPEMKQLPAFEVKVPDNPFPSEANSLFQIPVII
ncbi:hypothetical protein KKA14_16115, partial [bacterium]|nr:hypothetical protein [bacterium]